MQQTRVKQTQSSEPINNNNKKNKKTQIQKKLNDNQNIRYNKYFHTMTSGDKNDETENDPIAISIVAAFLKIPPLVSLYACTYVL